MAENLTIARPYAQAIFEQALSGGSLDEWEQILQILSDIAGNSQARALFDNPVIQAEQLRALLQKTTEQALPSLSVERQKQLHNLVQLLIEERRLAVLPEILTRFQQLLTAQRELKEVKVVSAYPLDNSRQQSMISALEKYLHSKITVDFSVDETLIGGAVIRSGNWVMDGSIKGKLQRLRDSLQS